MSLAEAFGSIFQGHPGAHYVFDPRKEPLYRYITVNRGITEDDIARHLRGELPGLLSIPIFPTKSMTTWHADSGDVPMEVTVFNCHFAAGDCDRHSEEDEPINYVAVARRITKLGLPLVITRSKSPKSAHCWLSFKDAAGFLCSDARRLIEKYMVLLGITRGVEVFPKQDSLKDDQIGSGINLPYFSGERIAFGRDGEELDLAGFIELVRARQAFGQVLASRDLAEGPSRSGDSGASGEEHPMLKETVREFHAKNLEALRQSNKTGRWNDMANKTAFWAGRCFVSIVFDESEGDIKNEMVKAGAAVDAQNERQLLSTLASGWGSGILKPLKILENKFPERDEVLKDFNERFYVVENLGGKCRVAWETIEKATGALTLGHQSFDDFRNRFMHQMVVVGEEVEKSMEGASFDLSGKSKETRTPIFLSKGKFWLLNPERRQYSEVVYRPGETVGPELRNLWRGFSVEPKKGNVDLYLAHVLENVCKGDKAKFQWLTRWMAWKIRNPGMKSYTCPVLTGSEGIGKNVCIDAFAFLWGPHAFPVTQKSHVTGHFNFHFIACSVLIANEAFFAADKGQEGTLKSLITDDSFMLEGKGINAVPAKNILSVVVISNEIWAVPAGITARRFSIFDCGDAHKEDFEYFNRISLELGGAKGKKQGYSALLWYLLHEVEMGDFQPHQIIRTEALSVVFFFMDGVCLTQPPWIACCRSKRAIPFKCLWS